MCTIESVVKPRKLLPRPCPKCGNEYGTAQFVIFNDEYHSHKSYRGNNRLRALARISHPGLPRLKEWKPWCNFRTEIIDPEKVDLLGSTSITIPVKGRYYDHIKKYGWGMIESNRKKVTAKTQTYLSNIQPKVRGKYGKRKVCKRGNYYALTHEYKLVKVAKDLKYYECIYCKSQKQEPVVTSIKASS